MISTISNLRITIKAYEIAKNRAKQDCITMCAWVSRAIEEKAILDDLIENKEDAQ
ncbi:MAG: hypothetical protein AB9856_14330 [Cellulosilyticaceae bacterium]